MGDDFRDDFGMTLGMILDDFGEYLGDDFEDLGMILVMIWGRLL